MGISALGVARTFVGRLARGSDGTSDGRDPQWLRDLRYTPELLLHRQRRRAARRQLRDCKPSSVLFLCHGNICRSPFAAAIFARAISRSAMPSVSVLSAGLMGAGRKPPLQALAAARRYGVDLSSHRSVIAERDILKHVDLIVVMTADQASLVRAVLRSKSARVVVLGDLDPSPLARRAITDPWGGPDMLYVTSYDRIERCVRELVGIIKMAA